jgi:4-diphosphocytidyl-2-C-methyl-D-erythritol kinase
VRLRAFAPAKVNLFLHVAPPRADGKHPLSGLSAFADVGDRLTLDADGPPGLRVEGPLAAGVPTGPENLVSRALAAFSAATGLDARGLSIVLEKHLPSAAGIGGGTSDAGAALRLARAALAPDLPDAALLEMAATLGADGPMCLFPTVSWTSGLGEILTPEPRLPPLHAVLVNPRVPVPTGAVFAAYDAGPMRRADTPPPPADWSYGTVTDWLASQRNDLQPAAESLCPAIAHARQRIAASPEILLTRMSGSGATLFGLCRDAAAAARAAAALGGLNSEWWVVPVRLDSVDAAVSQNPAD